MTVHSGSCHCGAVKYEADVDLSQPVLSCNCSHCQKLGSLLAAADRADFKLLSGEGSITEYQFNKKLIHHPFCATCGIQSYAYGKGPGGKDMVMLNVRCLDGVDPEKFAVMKFDGRSM